MAQNFTYNGYTYSPFPQVTRRVDMRRSAEGSAATAFETITASQRFDAGTYVDNMVLAEAMKAAHLTDRATLVWNDGSQDIVNGEVLMQDYNEENGWNQYHMDVTVTYGHEITTTAGDTFTVTYDTFTFTPPPDMTRSVRAKRKGTRSDIQSLIATVRLSGYFRGSRSANVTKQAAIEAAVKVEGKVLTYGTFVQTMDRTKSVNFPSTDMNIRTNYEIEFEYDVQPDGGWPSDIVESDININTSLVYIRRAEHTLPFVHGKVFQNMGYSTFTKTYSGYFVGLTLADAIVAYKAEVAAAPTGGILKSGGFAKEDAASKRVDFSVTYEYTDPTTCRQQYEIQQGVTDIPYDPLPF